MTARLNRGQSQAVTSAATTEPRVGECTARHRLPLELRRVREEHREEKQADQRHLTARSINKASRLFTRVP